jgi:hypothetical protein
MKFWDKIRFWFSDYKVVNKIEIEYYFYTKSGYKVCTIDDEIKHKPNKVYKYASSIYMGKTRDIKTDKNNVDIFNKAAKEYLIEKRKSGFVTLEGGVMISGNYIIKCDWDVYLKYRDATFKEYMELKHE